MNAQKFAHRFSHHAVWGGKTYGFDRPLLHLGMPRPEQLTLWCARGVGATGGARVKVTVKTRDGTIARALEDDLAALSTGTARIAISGLEPGTRYQVVVESDWHAGPQTLAASTAPAAASAAPFRFLAFSCFSPYGGGKTGTVSGATTHALGLLRARAQTEPPAFMLAMGDQVYVDEGGFLPWPRANRALIYGFRAGAFAYDQAEASKIFTTLYRRFFAIPPFDEALARIPCAMMWDDHDIRDGWGSQRDQADPGYSDAKWARHLAAARAHFYGYQVLRSPVPAARAGAAEDWRGWEDGVVGAGDTTARPELDYAYDWGALATFFVMDLRSHRNYWRKEPERVISSQQYQRLERWLNDPKRHGRPQVFVLVSSMPLTTKAWSRWSLKRCLPMRGDDWRDNWAAANNVEQRDRILSLLVRHFAAHPEHRLLILSGDIHHSEVRQLRLDAPARVLGHEIISSGLAQSMFPGAASSDVERDSNVVVAGLVSERIGVFRGGGFAELSVAPAAAALDGRAAAPEVGFLFHASAEAGGKVLNPTAAFITDALKSDALAPLTCSPSAQPDPFAPSRTRKSTIPTGEPRATWDDALP